ncbi:sulfocyanin-like copper-binding protein [Alicyclobacillus sp.]|uniref:sulfocyanin-like copper-binding protein n=1 Tax=Alicyclobacillus sp. TaxID=61169 RepID=UPI0025C48BDD|nr:sulfocyanin-like copper-binding protein [Alicyclobacillus sp.]MCL6515906.1 hypothetical protein [Alicyclobacillus sp.]
MWSRILTGALCAGLLCLTCGCQTHGPSAMRAWNSVGATGARAGGAHILSTAQWMRSDPAHRAVDVTLVAGMHGDNNFNGYPNGTMTIAIPPGWQVRVHYRNESATAPHSAVVVPFVERAGGWKPAFPGAHTPNFAVGTPPGGTADFHFTADHVGRYAVVCGVAGHRDKGMWAALTVADDVVTPRIYVSFEG